MAVHRACGTRDPFPYPAFESDDAFVGRRATQKHPFTLSVRESQSANPFQRLFNSQTLSSSRHQVFHFDPRAPKDDLDFLLKATYNQHGDTLKPLAPTRMQKETISDDHGRILKNRVKLVVTPPPALNHPLRIAEVKEKHKIEQAKLAIGSNHTILTNNGYSRKPNGGFYNA